jgi:hypothetical protein
MIKERTERDKLETGIKVLKLTQAETKDFNIRLAIQDDIHALQMKLDGVTPTGHSPIECIGCGS